MSECRPNCTFFVPERALIEMGRNARSFYGPGARRAWKIGMPVVAPPLCMTGSIRAAQTAAASTGLTVGSTLGVTVDPSNRGKHDFGRVSLLALLMLWQLLRLRTTRARLA